MTAPEKQVVSLYERHARAWVADRQRGAFLERRWLERFVGLLPRGAAVLDIGCGAGAPIASFLLDAGCRVTGIDSSPTMIELCRARHPHSQWLVADMRTLALGRSFQGVVAWDSFFHLARDDQRRMFATFRAHAAVQAPLLFTSGPGDGEAIGSYAGEPLYHASLSAEEYRSLLQDHGFAVREHVAEDPQCGQHTVWLAQRET
jgi:SAM-dependent methyltransferase